MKRIADDERKSVNMSNWRSSERRFLFFLKKRKISNLFPYLKDSFPAFDCCCCCCCCMEIFVVVDAGAVELDDEFVCIPIVPTLEQLEAADDWLPPLLLALLFVVPVWKNNSVNFRS